MTIRQRIGAAIIGEKSFRNLTMQVLGLPLGSGDGQASEGYGPFGDAYKMNADVHAVLQQLGSNLAGIPFKVLDTSGDQPEQVDADNALRQLLLQPNPWEAYSDYVEHWVGDMYLGGRSFQRATIATMGGSREASELVLMRPDNMTVDVNAGAAPEDVLTYVHGRGKDEKTYTSEEVLPIAFFSPGDEILVGQSPLSAAIPGISGGTAGRKWNISLLENGAMPSGAVTIPEGVFLDPEGKQGLREQLRASSQGVSNAGNILLLDGGSEFSQMSLSPADMDWTAGLAMNKRDIATVCKVPSLLVGDNEAKTYANYHEARVALYLEAILPLADRLLDNWNSWLSPKFGDNLVIALDLSDVEALREDVDALWSRVDSFTWMTPNEKRAAIGLQPFDDPMADVIWTPPNLLPLGLAQSTDEDNSDTASRAMMDQTKRSGSESGSGKRLTQGVDAGSLGLSRWSRRGSVKRVGGSLLLFGNVRRP